MSLQQLIGELQRSGGLERLAAQIGIDSSQAQTLANMIAPTIGSAASKQVRSGHADRVFGQLRGEDRARYWQEPEAAAQPDAMAAGASFLEELFGSREATREIASAAASRARVEPKQVEAFMPALAAMLQGGMQQRAPDSEIDDFLRGGESGSTGGGGLMDLVSGLLGGSKSTGGGLGQIAQMLDADGDGSPLDDILQKVMKT